MSTKRIIRLGIGWGGCLAVAMVAACSDTVPTAPSNASQLNVNPFVASLTTANVVVPGVDAGGFFNLVNPTNAGRITGAFWDNPSNDGPDCNIGFYALGTMTPGSCAFAIAGSDANQGGGYTMYWGDNGPNGTMAGRDAASFMFNGANYYTVKLLGTYAAETSEVGWFTKTGGVYTFHEVTGWTNKVINTTIQIPADGTDWGFYVHNTFAPFPGGCSDPVFQHDCSDATGGFNIFTGGYNLPVQQFVLLSNPTDATKYMAAAEDNQLEILGSTGVDADYQDYIWSIVAGAGQGCSHGYWKNHSTWPSPYTPSTLFSSVFENAFPGQTLLQVLQNTGGGLDALGRETVGALLNAQQFGAAPFGMSAADVISAFNATFPGTKPDYNALKGTFESLTDISPRVCPLN